MSEHEQNETFTPLLKGDPMTPITELQLDILARLDEAIHDNLGCADHPEESTPEDLAAELLQDEAYQAVLRDITLRLTSAWWAEELEHQATVDEMICTGDVARSLEERGCTPETSPAGLLAALAANPPNEDELEHLFKGTVAQMRARVADGSALNPATAGSTPAGG